MLVDFMKEANPPGLAPRREADPKPAGEADDCRRFDHDPSRVSL